MQQQIKAYYQATFADKQHIQVSDPERIADGWETEIFSFEIDYFLNGEPIHENIIMKLIYFYEQIVMFNAIYGCHWLNIIQL